MGLIDKVFGIEEKIKERVALEKAEMNRHILETEQRMMEVSEQRTQEKAQEIVEIMQADLVKAEKERYDSEAKSYMYDPFYLLEAIGYKERVMSMSYDTLRLMSERNAVVAAIINTRIHQVTSFARQPRTKYDIGFELVMRDSDIEPTKEDERKMKEIELMLLSTGYSNVVDEESRDSFETFLAKITRDSLTYDQATWETVNGRGKYPVAFYAVDGASIRFASTMDQLRRMSSYSREQLEEMWIRQMHLVNAQVPDRSRLAPPEKIRYVQVINSRVMNTYTEQELAFGIRNPRTHLQANNYGVSELEILTQVVTAHLWAEEYNRRFFSSGSAPKGFIHFDVTGGTLPQEQLNAFRRQWHAQVAGVWNAWKTPIIAMPGKMQYQNLQMGNRQMEFTLWIEYLVKLLCALYLIDPHEINFEMKGSPTGQAPQFYSVSEAKLKMSRDRGLQPLLRFFESEINKNLIWRINPRYEFQFVGMDSRLEKDMQELRIKELQNWKTLDEVRVEDDLDPLGEEKGGDLILNPQYVQYYIQKKQVEAMAGMQTGGGPGGGEAEVPSPEEEPDFGTEGEGPEESGEVFSPRERPGMNELDKLIGQLRKKPEKEIKKSVRSIIRSRRK